MGLREKVTITLVIITLIQIACRHCMPRTPRKVSLKHYLNDLKPVKNNPVPTPTSPLRVNKIPKQTFGKTAQNGRINQNSLPKKPLYQTYNFPENEYPLDNSPRDPFRIGMNFYENNHVNTLQKARNLQSSAIRDFKNEMKMKRKLLSNKQVNNENSQMKTDILCSIKSSSNPDPIRLLDSETFPEVQYPLNTMDTWGPNYWNYLPFTREKPFHRYGQQTFNPKANEDINKPFTRMTKAKASKYLQSYDKLKEEHRRTSTENSKRSNVGQKGLNFTKTATCERVSDDFITAGLLSNILSNSTEIKKALTSSANISTSSENTCLVTEYPYHPMPIPYKVIEENTENIYSAEEPKNKTKKLQDEDNSVIAQTLQLIQEILLNDDTSSTALLGHCSKEIEKNMNTSDYSLGSVNEDISATLMDGVKSCTPTKELSQEVSDNVPAGNLRNNMTSLPAELIPENMTAAAGPLNVRMPLPFSEPITYEAYTNALNPGLTPSPNGNAVPGSTSIIIIPFNNNTVGKSQSHMFGTSPDTQIIVYLPSTQSSNNPSQPSPFNQIVSSSIDRPVPNNQLYNVLSNMAPLQNDNLFSTTLVSELLNSNSYIGSSLPIHETLPTNSMCYNNESSQSSMREKPISDILIDKSLTDDAHIVTTTWDEKLSENATETGDLDVNTDPLPPILDFGHPLFDFSGSDFTSISHGPYNNVLNNELPIIAREIYSDQEISNVSYKDLLQNTMSEQIHKTIYMDSTSEDSLYEIPTVGLDKNFSSVTYLQELVDTRNESLSQSIDKILLFNPLIETPTTELLLPTDAPLTPAPLFETFSDKLPEIIDEKLFTTLVSDTTTDSAPRHISNTNSPPILNSSPMMTDMTLKTELYKMRQILDKMLSTETSTYSQPPPIDTKLLPISETDSLLLPMNEMPAESLPFPATDSPMDSSRKLHETLLPISVDRTPTNTLPLPGHKLFIPNKLLETDTPSLLIDEIVPPIIVSESSADNKPYDLDNLVTPLSETVTLRTKDTLNNGLSYKMDDLPLKMDLKFPDTYVVSSDDLPLSVDDLPTKVHPEYTTINPAVPMNNLPTPVETLTPVSEVRDLPKPTDMFSLPEDGVLAGAPDVLTDSVKTLMNGSIDKFPSDGLPTLPMNEFKLSIHETFSDGRCNEISSKGPPQKVYLPLSVQKLIPDLSHSDVLTNEPSLKDYSPSLVIDKNIEFPYSTEDTKDLPLVVEHLLRPENDATLDSLVTDIPSAVSLSTNLDRLSESTLSDLPRDDLPLPEDKMLSFTDNTTYHHSLPINITPSTSKLPIAKILLENLLSDITTGSLSSLVVKDFPVIPHSILDKTLHYVNVKSPLSATKYIPLRAVGNIFLKSEHTNNLIESDVPFSKKTEITSITGHPSELQLSMHEMHKDKPNIPTDDVKDHEINETQSLDNSTHDLPVTIDKVSPPKNTTKSLSSSKLPITKALLDNVLTDITTRDFSVPVVQSLSVTSPSVLDKPLYYVETPISYINENSCSLPVNKIQPNTSLSDHSIDNLPISTEDTLPLPIDKTFSELQRLDIPTELSLTIDNIQQDIPIISMSDKEQEEIGNRSSENLTDDFLSASPMEEILSLPKDTPSDLTLPNIKTPPSSKLPITKTLLEHVLTDITTRGFSVPVVQSLPVTSPSVLDKPLYYVETPISQINENSSSLPVDKILPNISFSDHPIDNLPISTEDTLPLPIDKTFSELQRLDIPTELSPTIDNIRQDIPIISMSDKEQDEIGNSSSENLTDDFLSASPMEEILSLPKDTLSDLTLPNIKTPPSSKLPITKTLLEHVLTDITTRGFSVPVVQSLPVTSPSVLDKPLHYVETPISHINENSSSLPVDKILPNISFSDHPIDNLPISTEDTLPLSIDKTFSELQSFHVPTELSSPIDNIRQDIPIISMSDKEQDEIGNPSSENLTDDFISASPMEGILSLPKDTPSDLTLPNIKTPSSSKLPITKTLLEHVLTDITTRSFSVPIVQSLPVTSPSVLDKPLYYVETPISHINENSSSLPVDKILHNISFSDHPIDNLPIFVENTLPLSIDKTFSELQSLDVPTELSSPTDNIRQDIPIISMSDKEQHEIENPSSENLTDDFLSASPMEGILSLPKDTPSDLTLPNIKTPSSSKLPITKTLLEHVLTDITTRGFSVPVAQSLPVTSPSVLDKPLYYVETPISQINENSSSLPVDKILPNISFSDHPIDNLPIFVENTLPLSIDKTFSELQSLDVSTELSSTIDNIRQDIPIISMSDKEQDDIGNPSSENLTDDVLLASLMEGILSLPKDTPSDLTLPNIKTPSSSKLPITKTLLEHVLTDITTRGFSVPAAQSLPVTSPSVLDKPLYYVETPISQINENSSSLPVDKILPNISFSDHPIDNLPISVENTLPLSIDKTFSELQSDVSTELSSTIDNIRQDIPIISMSDKEQDEIGNSSSENLTDDFISASPMEGILSLPKDTPSDLSLTNIKTPSSSKLPITKTLLEHVLTDITTRGFSVPVVQSLPVTSPSVLNKPLYYVETPISQINENSSSLPVDKILPNISFSDHPIDNLPISVENTLPLSIDKTFSELQSLDVSTELSSTIDNIRQDIPIISMSDKEQDEIGNSSSENLTDDVLSASPMEGILSLPKDTPSDVTLTNIKTPSSSKLPITKTLLEHVLTDITTRGFSVPVVQSLPVTSPSVLDKPLYYVETPISQINENSSSLPVDKILPNISFSDHPIDNLPISVENTLPLSIDKTFSELQSDVSTELSSTIDNIRQDIPIISMSDKEQDEIGNPSSENLTDDFISASPMEGILSLPKDTPSDLSLTNIKTPSSSKLPITKTLLEHVLTDITTRGFSVPVAQSLPVTSPSVLNKPLYYVETPISQINENSSSLPVDKILPNISFSDHPIDNLPIFVENTLPLSIDKTFSELQSLDVSTELSSTIDNIRQDIPIISMSDKEQDEIGNSSSENLTDDVLSASPMEGILSLPKDTPSDVTLTNIKTPSSSKLPITKTLLEHVLTDITTRGFSVPVVQSLPVTSPSVLDKPLYYVETPISHINENSSSLPVDKILPNISFSDHPIDNLPISVENTLPLSIDKTFSELQSLHVPTELSSPIDNIRQDIPIISMSDKEQDEIENLSSENLTDDFLSVSPFEGIPSFPKDTPSDLTLPNFKTLSSSKLPVTKALLESVLTDITTKSFSVPVAQSLPVTSHSVLDKTLHYVESPISYIIENSSSLPVNKILPNTSLSDHPTDNLLILTEDTLALPINKTFSELQSLDIPTELSSPIDKIRQYIPIITMYDKVQDALENPSSENLSDDLSSVSPMEEILSLSKDTPSDLTLPNIKTPSSSKLPITKALLENVLSVINTRGFSLPVAKVLPVASRSQLHKKVNFLEYPVSDMTEKSSVISTDNFPSSGINADIKDNPILDIPTDKLLLDKIYNSFILTNDVEQEVKSDHLTDNVEDRDTSDSLPDDVEQEDKSNILTDVFESRDISDILTNYVKDEDKSDILPDAVEDRDKSNNFTDYIGIEDSNESLFSDDSTDDIPSDLPLPRTKLHLASRIPITKALLEKVLSDITDGGIYP